MSNWPPTVIFQLPIGTSIAKLPLASVVAVFSPIFTSTPAAFSPAGLITLPVTTLFSAMVVSARTVFPSSLYPSRSLASMLKRYCVPVSPS